ncbi:MAG: Ig-like domain-containing protein [Acidobacteriota bacterium]
MKRVGDRHEKVRYRWRMASRPVLTWFLVLAAAVTSVRAGGARLIEPGVCAGGDGVPGVPDPGTCSQGGVGDPCSVNRDCDAPVAWPTATPVRYQVDRGPLGTLSNAQATALVREAFDTLEGVATASIRFQMTGQLPVDVTELNWALFFGIPGDGRSPVVFDTDGRILDQLLGLTARNDIEGDTLLEQNSGTVLREVSILINGACFDGIADATSPCELASLDELRALILHEAGHFSNLDHADLNRRFAGDGSASNNAVLPTMYPVQTEDDRTLTSLNLDDELALSTLYPLAPFPSDGGRIEGRILDPNGVPLDGANVIVHDLEGPFLLAASTVSGDVGGPGAYLFAGLPPGNYTVETGPIASAFSTRSSVGQAAQTGIVRLPGPGEFLDSLESADAALDDPGARATLTLHAGTVLTGQDIILNDLTTLLDDQAGTANNDAATATVVDSSGDVVGDRITPGDVDYFRISMPAGWTLRVDVDAANPGLGSSLSPIVGFFDATATPISDPNVVIPIPDPASGETGLADPSFDFINPGGDVIVAVASAGDTGFTGTGGTSTGPYYLRLTPVPPAVASRVRLAGGGGVSTDAPVAPTVILTGSVVGSFGGGASSLDGSIVASALAPDPPADADGDGVADLLDPCPTSGDLDMDGVCDALDNCPNVVNPSQADGNGNGSGNACDVPTVAALLPPDGSTQVPLSSSVQILFSEPISFTDPNGPAPISLEGPGMSPVPVTLTLSLDGRIATLDPNAALAADSAHAILMAPSIQDQDAGNPISFGGATFTTASAPPPPIPVDQIGPAGDPNSAVEGTTSTGTATGDLHGAAVASDGDVNGDGFSDILIGAPMADGAAPASGEAVLILGQPGLVAGSPATRIRFVGASTGDEVGRAVAFMGDVTGDGIGDFLIGAPGAAPAGLATGAAFLVFGQSDMAAVASPVDLSTIDDPSCGPCGVVLAGEALNDRLGSAVSFAGDFNQDDRLDLLVGAPGRDVVGPADPNDQRPGAGVIYLLFGSDALNTPSTISLTLVGDPNGVPGVVFLGENGGDAAGASVSDWRDRTEDGVDDLLIGSPDADVLDPNGVPITDAGTAYSILGSQNFPSGTIDLRDIALSVPGVVFLGETDGARAGFSVSGHHDVTGDGEFDLLIGGPGMSFPDPPPGRMRRGAGILIPSSLTTPGRDPVKRRQSSSICLGRRTTPTGLRAPAMVGLAGGPMLRTLAGALNVVDELEGVIFSGEATDDEAGSEFTGAGDVNGDGIGDLLLGAPGFDLDPTPMVDTGRAYLILGQAIRPPGEVPLADVGVASAGLVFDGQTPSERLGSALAGAGDVDGTGFTELLLGAPGAATAPPNSGTVYITLPAIVSEPADLVVTGGATAVLEWDAVPGAIRHLVYRGSLTTLAVASQVRTSDAVCLTPGSTPDADADMDGRPDLVDTFVPPAGDGSWFLVTGTNSLGEGLLGMDTAGALRRNDGPCP